MVQELPDGHALRDRSGVAVEPERTLVDELEHDRGDEDLRHASDPEAVSERQALARLHIRFAGRGFQAEPGPTAKAATPGRPVRTTAST